MLAAVIIISVVLTAGLIAYAMHRSKPSRFTLKVGLPKFPLVSIEFESDDQARRELPPKTDDAG